MSSDCPECGGALVWAGQSWCPHSDTFHALQRRFLIIGLAGLLRREIELKEWLAELDRDDMIGFRWRNGVYPGFQFEDRWQIPTEWWEGCTDTEKAQMLRVMRANLTEKTRLRYGIDVNPATWFHRMYTPQGEPT